MKIAYCDCFSGISGDMFLAALLDAGLPLDYLQAQIDLLGLSEGVTLHSAETHKGALRARSLRVEVAHAPHHHRHLNDILELIAASQLSATVKAAGGRIFELLAQAEGRVHGEPVDHVHFHEVGATDSLVDTLGAVIGLEYLGVERLYASALPLGSGQIPSQHGILPLPAPATLEVLRLIQAPTVPSNATVELVTPTGAAILGALASFEQPAMRIGGVGVGAGQRDLPWPNILRLILGESRAAPLEDEVVVLETNIDDMNPQVFGHLMGHLFAAGALDVYLTPISMKKNRPATLLGVIARRSAEAAMAQLILGETSTFGVRVHPVRRYEAERTFQTVSTAYGDIPLKLKILAGQVVQAAPEYDVCARLADEHGVPLMQVYQAALAAVAAPQ